MALTHDHHNPYTSTRSRRERVIVAVCALAAAWLVFPSARPLVLAGALIGVAVFALQPARATPPDSPMPDTPSDAPDDATHLLVEDGMRDLTRYLQQHAAFAAYLAQRPTSDPPPRDDQRHRQPHA